MNSKKPRVLIVEDNSVDVQILQHAFSATQVTHEIDVAGDGESALRYLRQQAEVAQTALPRLVILDLNLPKISGIEVLREIKASPRLRRIPVIVMSSSRSEKDVTSAYDEGASLYARKPTDLESLEQLIGAIATVWLQFAVPA